MIGSTLLPLLIFVAMSTEVSDPQLHRVVASATVAIIAPRESAALGRLMRSESRGFPSARSKKGACGLFQQVPRWVPGSTCRHFQTLPIYAAIVVVQKSRAMRRLCGDRWVQCYKRGPWHRLEVAARRDRAEQTARTR